MEIIRRLTTFLTVLIMLVSSGISVARADDYDDFFKKMDRLKVKAVNGDTRALNWMAFITLSIISTAGDRVKYDGPEATETLKFLLSQYKEDNPELALYIARYYGWGIGAEKNIPMMEEWSEKSARRGNREAQTQLGHLLLMRLEYGAAREWFEKAARQGDPDAQYTLAGMYYQRRGVQQDCLKALRWSIRSASSQAPALVESIKQDPKCAENMQSAEAQFLMRPTVDLVNPTDADEQYALAGMYDDGGNRHIDYVKARYWYQKSADQGSLEALFAIALMYEKGKGTPPDERLAWSIYSQAVDRGDSASSYSVDRMAPYIHALISPQQVSQRIPR